MYTHEFNKTIKILFYSRDCTQRWLTLAARSSCLSGKGEEMTEGQCKRVVWHFLWDCMFLCVPMYARAHGIQRSNSSIIPPEPSILFLRQSLTEGSSISLNFLATKLQGFTYLHLPSVGVTSTYTTLPIFYMDSRDLTQFLTLLWQHFTD